MADLPDLREIEQIRADVALWISSPAALDPLSYRLCVDAAALVEEFVSVRARLAQAEADRDRRHTVEFTQTLIDQERRNAVNELQRCTEEWRSAALAERQRALEAEAALARVRRAL